MSHHSPSTTDNERRYYDALKRIARHYGSAEYVKKHASKWGLENGNEALEYAYENIQAEANEAIRGRRRPPGEPTTREAAEDSSEREPSPQGVPQKGSL